MWKYLAKERFLNLVIPAIGIALFGFSMWGVFEGSRLALERKRVNELKRENRELRDRLSGLEEQVRKIHALIDTVYVRDLALRTLAGLEYPRIEYDEMGIGGFLEESEDGMGRRIQSLEQEIEKLMELSNFELKSFEEIQAKLEEDQRVRDHTPSIIPVRGFLTSRFGYRRDPFTGQRRFHEGIDIVAPVGMPIVAPADGRVRRVKWEPGFGLVLEVDHGYGIYTRYAHNSRILVRPGQRMKRGQIIGYVGNTGRSTGPHLHYEVRVDGRPTNPLKFIIPAGVYYD